MLTKYSKISKRCKQTCFGLFFLTIVHFHKAMVDEEYCDCQVPCSQIKYHPEVSYSKFPDASTADSLIKSGYYADIQYQR